MQKTTVARIADAFGKVEKKLPGNDAFRALSVGDRLPAATTLRTGTDAALLVELPDNHVVRVGANTTVILNQIGADKQFALKVLSGQVWALVKKANHPTKFTVETSSGVAGVTGTVFGVGVDEETNEMVVSTAEGSVEVQSFDAAGRALESPVPVLQGMMLRAVRKRALQAPHSQAPQHRNMWRALYREGAWTQQNAPGLLHLNRGRETELMHSLRMRVPRPLGNPPRRPGRDAKKNW
ncbi:FecR domain-containing protein [Armatimonas sp.]|uniref:FecR family protein n=1 Tax=Armatimonas sp. TaxID=1872638 RepID=UPI003752496F